MREALSRLGSARRLLCLLRLPCLLLRLIDKQPHGRIRQQAIQISQGLDSDTKQTPSSYKVRYVCLRWDMTEGLSFSGLRSQIFLNQNQSLPQSLPTMDNKKAYSGVAKAASKSSSTLQTPAANPPITQAEKKWLKNNYKDEFHFLRNHGLSIYKEDDREEGRLIMRAMMEQDEGDDEKDSDSDNSFLRELEEDPMSHVADYHFSAKQLDWIKKHYKHSANFLHSYGLKPFDDGDCQEGKKIVQGMMDDDE